MLCEKCNTPHDGSYGSGRFCTGRCARSFSSTANIALANQKRSATLKGRSNPSKGTKKSTKWHDCPICNTPTKTNFCSVDCFKANTQLTRDALVNYRHACEFMFDVYDYPTHFDLSLVEMYGWYSASNRGNNLTGVSRDHMYSVSEGFKNAISPSILSHPANCRLMQHGHNSSKKGQCSITLENLLIAIEAWDLANGSSLMPYSTLLGYESTNKTP